MKKKMYPDIDMKLQNGTDNFTMIRYTSLVNKIKNRASLYKE